MPDESLATPAPFVQAAPLPTGPVIIVMNEASGSTDKAAAREAIQRGLQAVGREFEFAPRCAGGDPAAACARAAGQVARRGGGVLLAAGGDGTISAAAHAAWRERVPLAVVPLGTFNYFARLHGIPDDPEAAARLTGEGELRTVGAGEVNGRLFVNNASFGLYTRLIHQRERAKARYGRWRIVAALSAIGSLLKGQRPFSIRIVDGVDSELKYTAMLFAGCNAFQLEALGLRSIAEAEAAEALGVLLLRPTRWWDRLRLLLRTALKELDEDHRLQTFCATDFEVHSRRRVIELAADGEILRLPTPLRFRRVSAALQLVVPRSVAADPAP